MLNNGDKLVVKKKVSSFLDEGDIAKVINIDEDGIITFAFGDGFIHMGVMSNAECEEHFEKYVEKPKNTVTEDRVKEIIDNSEIEAYTVFGKCTVVALKMPNGFVIVESSACVSPENYDEELGVDICLGKIADKIWELEGYKLQEEVAKINNDWDWNCCDCCCDECDEEEFDECLDTDLDCDDCEDYECPYNPNR